jgi:hypothetical protein
LAFADYSAPRFMELSHGNASLAAFAINGQVVTAKLARFVTAGMGRGANTLGSEDIGE